MQNEISDDNFKLEVVPDEHLTYLIAKVEHRLSLNLDRALRPTGVTLTQFSALANIGAKPGISGAALARALLTTPQAVTTLIRRLCVAGLVTHEQQSKGLPSRLSLTQDGISRLQAAEKIAQEAEKQNLSALSSEEQSYVFTHLSHLYASLTE